MKVAIVQFEETKIAYLEHKGSHELVFDTVSKFIDWRKETGLSPIKTSNTFGLVFDDPEVTAPEDFRFGICGSVTSDIPMNPQGVTSKTIPAGRCAVVRHYGSHNKLGDPVRALYRDWLPNSGDELRDFPCFFHYLNCMNDVKEHELETDIYLSLI